MHRSQLINILIDHYGYRSYLELGCYRNDVFDTVNIQHKIGVDIEAGGTIRSSTDTFFEQNREKFDIIFIDACHEHKQVAKDLDNSIQHLNDNGCIVLHDCLPSKEEDQSIHWNGTVWKAVVEARSRNDVIIITVDSDQGCGVVFKQPNNNPISQPTDLSYETYEKDRDHLLNVIHSNELSQHLIGQPNDHKMGVMSSPNWGRMGHQFSDLVGALIVSEIFSLKYYYGGFSDECEAMNGFLNLGHGDPQPPIWGHGTHKTYDVHYSKTNWGGIGLKDLRDIIRNIPHNTILNFTNSTFISLNTLWQLEQQHDVVLGTHAKVLRKLQNGAKSSVSMQQTQSDFKKSNKLTIAAFVRTGGSLQDLRNGCRLNVNTYDIVLNKIRIDFPDAELDIKYYTQGPISDCNSLGFEGRELLICDNKYPRMFEVIKSIYEADIFIAGASSFSDMMTAIREKPSYSINTNTFMLTGVTREVKNDVYPIPFL